MATHSSVLAWRIPGTGERVGCRLWGHTKSDTTEATWQRVHLSCMEGKNGSITGAGRLPAKGDGVCELIL